MMRQRNIFQKKEWGGGPAGGKKELNKMKSSNLPDRKFKILLIMMLSKLGRRKKNRRI